MSSQGRPALLLLLLLALLAGCAGPTLPTPFLHEAEDIDPAVALDFRAVAVSTTPGPADNDLWRNALLAALEAQEIPAFAAPPPTSRTSTSGTSTSVTSANAQNLSLIIDSAEQKGVLTLSWQLRSPGVGMLGEGRRRQVLAQSAPSDPSPTNPPDPTSRPSLDWTKEIAAVVSNRLRAEFTPSVRETSSVALGVLTLPEGLEASALTRPLYTFLRRRGVRLLSANPQATLSTDANPTCFIDLKVVVSPLESGHEKIALTWSARSPKGEIFGSIEQSNILAAGELTRHWPQIAPHIAEGGAAGLADLMLQLQDKFH